MSAMIVFSPRFACQDWTHPPATQAHRFEYETTDYIRVESTIVQHVHRIGTFLAAAALLIFGGPLRTRSRAPVLHSTNIDSALGRYRPLRWYVLLSNLVRFRRRLQVC